MDVVDNTCGSDKDPPAIHGHAPFSQATVVIS